jgi:hypothetical protein
MLNGLLKEEAQMSFVDIVAILDVLKRIAVALEKIAEQGREDNMPGKGGY